MKNILCNLQCDARAIFYFLVLPEIFQLFFNFLYFFQGIKLRTGIVGIERGIQEKQKATDDNISVSFQDLSKLMAMANDMVHISKSISAKIRVSTRLSDVCHFFLLFFYKTCR